MTTSPDRLRELTQVPATDEVQAPSSRLGGLGAIWTPARLALAVALWPLLLGLLWWSGSPSSLPLLALAAGGVALSLVTYLPARGQSLATSIGAPCGIIGLVLPLLGAGAIRDGVDGPGVAYGVAMVAFGLVHRAVTGTACGPTTRR